jgi:hypothetical protein
LNLIGLFGRPADGPAVDLLLENRIPDLTDALFVEAAKKKSGFLGSGTRIELRELTSGERSSRVREAKKVSASYISLRRQMHRILTD